MRPVSKISTVIGGSGFMIGLLGTLLWSAERPQSVLPIALGELTRIEPVRVLPRTELLLLTVDARQRMQAGQPWSAWRMLMDRMDDPSLAPAEAVITAAEAAAAWGGWHHVPRLLEGQRWLDGFDSGRGVFMLARAKEEAGDEEGATEAFQRYIALGGSADRGTAAARLGRLLRSAGDSRGAAAAFAVARAELPQIADWMLALEAEQLTAANDPTGMRLARSGSAGSAPVRLLRARAEVAGLRAMGNGAEADALLEREIRVLAGQGAIAEASRLRLDRARILADQGRHDEARDLLRMVAWESGAPREARRVAADLLRDAPGTDAADHLARAAALEGAGQPGLAARALRSAIAAGAPDGPALELRLARLLYEARDYGPAREAFLAAADGLSEPELIAESRLYAARALYRASSRNRSQAIEEMRRVTERYPRTAAAGTAHFLIGDEASTLRAALTRYLQAAEITHSEDAREALYRAGDRALKLDDAGAAVRHWESYVARYPKGDMTARVAYEAGRLHERSGRDARARAMYTAAIAAEPTSYYAIRASNRLGTDPLGAIVADPKPWAGLASDPVEASNVLRRLDALRIVGLEDEWRSELDAAIRAFGNRPLALLTLGEGLVQREQPVEAIRIGNRLRAMRGGEWDMHTLRLVYPFPYRAMIERVAAAEGVRPSFHAALIRQESTFRPTVKSWVGATGLGQIMPATGAWLAPSVGIRNYEEKLLETPEVNLRMSAKYIGDLLRRYDGAEDLALAGYNAGPSRADRWRRTLGYSRDSDAFREAIPFDETRDYVKIVLRNAAVYERLYYPPAPAGLVRTRE